MDICLKNLLINNKELSINNLNKISVIIPIFNCQDFIKYTIRSIQNQNMTEFEIILVNDNSNDNSFKIINDLQKEDKRIYILNNKKNMGTLYSRCIGTLKSRGDYIFPLDNDDMLTDIDIFEYIYNIAKKDDYDIVEFKAFDIPNYKRGRKKIRENYFNHHPNNLILHQPELGIFPISKNYIFSFNDFHIWGKCIKTKIYKKAIKSLGIKRYSNYNCWTEDIIIILVIFNLANSFRFINKYGIFHMENIITTSYKLLDKYKILAEIDLLDIIIDFLKDIQEYKKFAVDKALLIAKMNILPLLNKKNYLYLKSILNKIIYSKNVLETDKKKIKIIFNITDKI